MNEEWMPAIAIGGGLVVLLALVGLRLGISRRRRYREDPRRTSFHRAVIDPRIARHGRAAWEHSAPPRDAVPNCEEVVIEEIAIPIEHAIMTAPVAEHTVIGYSAYAALVPRSARGPREQDVIDRHERERQPRRLARGSTPGIESPASLPARPTDWELGAPSVTARLRAAKRS